MRYMFVYASRLKKIDIPACCSLIVTLTSVREMLEISKYEIL